MSIYTELAYFENTFTDERVALPIGKYGNSKNPGLKVVKVLTPKPHPFLVDTTSYSYLVAATDKATPGTAFLTIDVRPYTLTNPAAAIAFQMEEKAIADELTTAEEVAIFKESLKTLAEAELKAKADKTGEYEEDPTAGRVYHITDEQLEGKYKNLTIELQKALGNIFALQAWAGHEVGISVDFDGFAGVQFAGSTEANYKNTGTDVKRVFKRASN